MVATQGQRQRFACSEPVRWVVRALGGCYFLAFASLWVQIEGLIGSQGILPVGVFLQAVQQQLGAQGYLQFPTLCWISSHDSFLHVLCLSGVVLSCALSLGRLQKTALVLNWLLYLSLTTAGQIFLGYQWDNLLLETGFLALLFVLWPSRGLQDASFRQPRCSFNFYCDCSCSSCSSVRVWSSW